MALILADRVRETTTSTGTGDITLAGALTGFQTFSAAVGNGNTTYYVIAGQGTSEWEVGVGTYASAGNTLARTTVLASSNAGALVNFSAGTKDTWVDYAAGKAVTTDTLAYPPAIGSTTPAAGTFTTLTATGQTSLGGAADAEALRAVTTASAINWIQVTGATNGNSPSVLATGANTSVFLDLASKGTSGGVRFKTAVSTEQMRVSHTASAVNYVQVTGAATGGSPAITAQGSDTNVGITVQGKGTGSAILQANSTGNALLATDGGLTAVRAIPRGSSGDTWLDVQRTSGLVALSAASGVTNGAFVVQSKGTGAIDLAAGSSGVNISNGGTVTAITRTSGGTGYTSVPTMAITAPTTAGGVQATATCTVFVYSNPITSAGSGYTVGDVLTAVGGTGTAYAHTVASVNGSGGVTAIGTITNYGNYSVVPTNPVAFTGGTGSGFTSNMTWTVNTTFTITNAGSGYVEQPTVSFSGGGGSGAAAYATVGSGAVIRSLGTTGSQSIDFHTPASSTNGVPVFRIRDTVANSYAMTYGATDTAVLVAQGAANAVLTLASNGTQSVRIGTNGSSTVEQMRVAHTASAVNYVQVTGAATGATPAISAQGSDTNIPLALDSKGTSSVFLRAGGLTAFATLRTASSVNYVTAKGSIASSPVELGAAGTDTNIDLTLTPKGTGNVRFGTYTGTILTPTGYIEIKDSGGTVRRLLVG